MRTIYSDAHLLHYGKVELIDGQLKPCFEMPKRAQTVLARVREVGLGDVAAPRDFGRAPIEAVHAPHFVQFLQDAWRDWSALGRSHDALPLCWPVRGLRDDRIPQGIDGRMGYYSMDAGVPITAGTWQAVYQSAQVALTGADALSQGERSAFALCRPPGHHAAADYMGGYCYLNNAAIAAQYLLDHGARRVLVLDVDYHHGNGTQSIFYRRADVSFVSLHGDPAVEYPSFLGYADEGGEGEGLGYNHNFPLPHGTDWCGYAPALDRAIELGQAYRPDAVVVSLGVDTFEEDPISRFKLRSQDYLRIGARIAALGRPALFVFEGGYAVDAVGVNAVNVLQGYEQAA
jgi:acetoin utilization deacetylase AcuC-like enzyme